MAGRSGLEASLNSYFDSGNRVVIISNIDNMDVEVAKIFYKYVSKFICLLNDYHISNSCTIFTGHRIWAF